MPEIIVKNIENKITIQVGDIDITNVVNKYTIEQDDTGKFIILKIPITKLNLESRTKLKNE